jgi:pyridoxamine 5'-phosphate oxidase
MNSIPTNPAVFDQSDPRAGWAVDQLLPDPLPLDPFATFVSWFSRARDLCVQPNANAFSLATIDADGTPAVRIVLCKEIDAAAGTLNFYTNYRGRKGRALTENPRTAACFHWDALDLQVRFEGFAVPTTAAESDAYFASRPWMSRIGAWASDQTEPVQSREAMLAKVDAALRQFGIDPANPPAPDAKVDVPRPPHWGGFRIVPGYAELWVGSKVRLHDRACWKRPLTEERDNTGRLIGVRAAGMWTATRLQP